MKNIGLICLFLIAGLGFTSCDDKDPVRLTFEDVYGRPGWETGVSAKYFQIDPEKGQDVTVEDLSEEGSEDVVFKVTTTGTSPFIMTSKALKEVTNVLSFEYKATGTIAAPTVQLDVTNAGTFGKVPPIEASSEWKTYTFDLGMLKSAGKWGSMGSSLKIGLGNQSGVELTIRNMEVRGRNAAEEAIASPCYFPLLPLTPNGNNLIAILEDVSPYKTYEYITYHLKPKVGDAFTYFICPTAMDENFNKLKFKYKSTTSFQMQVFFVIDEGASFHTDTFEAASDWKEVEYGFDMKKIKDYKAAAGTVGQLMRIDIDGQNDDTDIYFQGLCVSK